MSVGLFSREDNPVFFRMNRIETQMILNQAKDDGSASDPQRQAKDSDQGIGFSAFQVSQGDLEVLLSMGSSIFY